MQGFASGAGTVTGTLFLAEIAPKAIRGVLGALFSTNIMLGVMLGYWMNYIAVLHISATSHWQWRFPILFQMVRGAVTRHCTRSGDVTDGLSSTPALFSSLSSLS